LSTTTLQSHAELVKEPAGVQKRRGIAQQGSGGCVPGSAEAVEERVEVRLEVRPGDVLHRRRRRAAGFLLGRQSPQEQSLFDSGDLIYLCLGGILQGLYKIQDINMVRKAGQIQSEAKN